MVQKEFIQAMINAPSSMAVLTKEMSVSQDGREGRQQQAGGETGGHPAEPGAQNGK